MLKSLFFWVAAPAMFVAFLMLLLHSEHQYASYEAWYTQPSQFHHSASLGMLIVTIIFTIAFLIYVLAIFQSRRSRGK